MGKIHPDWIKEKIANRVNPDLAIAQARVESELENISTRFEQWVYDDYIATGTAPDKAKALSTSYGLFQIMGYNLKEMGTDVTKPEVANTYLISPTLQVNSYVTFSQQVRKEFSPVNDFLAAYNGGKKAVMALKTSGFYGKAEPYVYKVKALMEALTPDDRTRYTRFLSSQSTGFIIPIIILFGSTAYLYLSDREEEQ